MNRFGAPGIVLVLTFLFLSSLGCAAQRPALQCPAKGGPAWRELQSEHFVMKTDVSVVQAKLILSTIELLRRALLAALDTPDEPMDKVEVILFERHTDFFAVTGNEGLRGVFYAHLKGDVEIRPAIVSFGKLTYGTRSTLLHELTHQILRRHSARLPWWLNEGLAEHFSTLWIKDMENGVAVVGDPPLDVDFWTDDYIAVDTQRLTPKRWLPKSMAPSLDALLRVDPLTLPSGYEVAYYAASWKLIHVLRGHSNAAYAPHFWAMLSSLMKGVPGWQAFNAAYKDVPRNEIAAEYDKFLLDHGEYPGTVEFDPKPSEITESVLSDAEAHALWARLLSSAKNVAHTAEDELESAERENPAALPLLYARASLHLRKGNPKWVAEDIAVLLRSEPNNPSYLLLALLDSMDAFRRTKDVTPHSGKQDKVVELAQKLLRLATTSAQRSYTAMVLADNGRPGDAIELLQKATSADPSCGLCLILYADELLSAGSIEKAQNAAARALTMASDGGEMKQVRSLLQRIAEERAKQARIKGSDNPDPNVPPPSD